jgi:hypothetical protein
VSLLQPEQRTLVNEMGISITQMGRTVDRKMAALHGTLCTILPLKSNQYVVIVKWSLGDVVV